MSDESSVNLIGLELPLVEPGDDLASLILTALDERGRKLEDGDVLVLAQKIVSKSEDRYVALADVEPSVEAIELAGQVEKDPRLVELILRESNEVVRHRAGVLVVEHRSGVVLANAGIDQSNITHESDGDRVLLLPEDSDRSARGLREELGQRSGASVGVVIADSLGRAWRVGTVGVAIGVAGIPAAQDLRGTRDLFGRELLVTIVGTGDQLASAASLLLGQADEGVPVVLIRGLKLTGEAGTARDLVRDKSTDLFR